MIAPVGLRDGAEGCLNNNHRWVGLAVPDRPRSYRREVREGKHPSLMCVTKGGTFVHANDARSSNRVVMEPAVISGGRSAPRLALAGFERQVCQHCEADCAISGGLTFEGG